MTTVHILYVPKNDPGKDIFNQRVGGTQRTTHLKPGQIVFSVLARNATNEPNRFVTASIGLVIPADNGTHGYISEHHSFGETGEKAPESILKT